jgi:hypothetical protein
VRASEVETSTIITMRSWPILAQTELANSRTLSRRNSSFARLVKKIPGWVGGRQSFTRELTLYGKRTEHLLTHKPNTKLVFLIRDFL